MLSGRCRGRVSRAIEPSDRARIRTVSSEPVIGLEIHAQLLTATKIFCGCSTRSAPSPTPRSVRSASAFRGRCRCSTARAVELRDARGRWRSAARCTPRSIFARKNYFYPDLPKGYQISQYERPLATGGTLAFASEGRTLTHRHHPRAHGRGCRQVACTTGSPIPIRHDATSISTAAACRSSRS